MKKIYIAGENQQLRDELSQLFKDYELTENPGKDTEIVFEITNYDHELKFSNLEQIESSVSSTALIISTSLCLTALEQIQLLKNKERLIGIGLYPTFSSVKGIEITSTSFTSEEYLKQAEELFANAGKDVHKVIDRVGMINLRIISLIINEAYLVLQEGTSNKEDIDTAMKLGTNYPYGPIEWGERIGLDIIYNILETMFIEFGDDRYRVTPLLKETCLEKMLKTSL